MEFFLEDVNKNSDEVDAINGRTCLIKVKQW